MKYLILILLFCGYMPQSLLAQNLVPNGGFEEAIECPETLDALHFGCADWYKSIQVPGVEMYNNPSPDWFHTCSEFDELSPPNVAFGYQEPYEGDGFSAIITYKNGLMDIREVMGVQLNAPMNAGEEYFVQFYTSWGYSDISSLKSNNLAVKFTMHPIFESSGEAVNNISHFRIDTLISDSTSWLENSFQFTADSAYEYLHIGNFYTDEMTSIETVEGDFNVQAYYFIDNVSVQSALSVLGTKATGLKLHPNPARDIIHFELNTDSAVDIYLYSIYGNLVFSNRATYARQIDLSGLPMGAFVLKVQTAKTVYSGRIQHNK